MKPKNINKFIDTIFQDYESMKYERFSKRCKELGKDPEIVLNWLKQYKLIETFENGNSLHVEFKRYFKSKTK